MQHTLTSSEYSAVIDDQGARLIRLSLPANDFIMSDGAVSDLPSSFLFPLYGALSSVGDQWVGETKIPINPLGLFGDCNFSVSQKTEEYLALELRSNFQTYQQYPFDFLYRVVFRMVGPRIAVTVRVENHTNRAMPFMSGLSFCVRLPFDPGLNAEDYDVDFLYNIHPRRLKLFNNGLLDRMEPYELLYDHKLRLDASLPRDETVLLTGLPDSFSLLSHKGKQTLKFICPELPYRGFRVCGGAEESRLFITMTPAAPPSADFADDLTAIPGLTLLAPEESWQTDYSISMA